MTVEVLMSCMHQQDAALVTSSRLTGDVLMINQCDARGYDEYPSESGSVRMFSTCHRGITKSRNMAIENAKADICVLCDDDEVFVHGYEAMIRRAYEENPRADVIVFKLTNFPTAFPDKPMRLRFPQTMRVCSCQISFRRKRLKEAGVRFDELLGAGTGNGAEEELKFLLECQRAGLYILYLPLEIAVVSQEGSTWFSGFDETFFENRGATTRYILGPLLAAVYAVYYAVKKRDLYQKQIKPAKALRQYSGSDKVLLSGPRTCLYDPVYFRKAPWPRRLRDSMYG